MEIKDLKKMLGEAYTKYQSAVARNLHQSAAKETIANIVINNMDDILAAIDLADASAEPATYSVTPAVVYEDGGMTLTGNAPDGVGKKGKNGVGKE